jgi:UDP-glucose 4-epimerase
MRVLVTGGAGYIGSQTVRHLCARGDEVLVYDNLSNGHREAVASDVALQEGDVEDRARLREVIEGFSPDAAINFAGAIEPSLSLEEPKRFYDTNVGGVLALASALSGRGVPIVHSSTCAIYGRPAELPVTEDSPPDPESLYGETKRIAEGVLETFDRAYGLPFIALRYFNAAGADASGAHGADHRHRVHLITRVCLVALGEIDELEVHGDDYDTPDGTCLRDYIHVDDLATAHLRALDALREGAPSRIYNVGSGQPNSVLEVIEAVQAASGRKVNVRYGPRRVGDPAAVYANTGRITDELGWKSEHSSIEEITETSWRWHYNHPSGYGSR